MVGIYISSEIRRVVIGRANNQCEYCLTPAEWSPEIFEIEHVYPLVAGGRTELSNLAYACPACNRYKHNKHMAVDPETRQDVPLFHPHKGRWQDHFMWSEDHSSIIGTTATGRSTIVTLRMNRYSVQKFRKALVAIHQHPAIHS